MKLTLRQQLTQFAHVLQNHLFPVLEEATGELDDTARRLVVTLEMIPLARAGIARLDRASIEGPLRSGQSDLRLQPHPAVAGTVAAGRAATAHLRVGIGSPGAATGIPTATVAVLDSYDAAGNPRG